jgi:hypothetical protein
VVGTAGSDTFFSRWYPLVLFYLFRYVPVRLDSPAEKRSLPSGLLAGKLTSKMPNPKQNLTCGLLKHRQFNLASFFKKSLMVTAKKSLANHCL